MMDLRLLQLAIALDQHRNFGRAAEAMGITQPTLSRGIAALESTLNTRLFDRTNRRVEPTPAGLVVLARARALVAHAAALQEAVDAHTGLRSGHVRIGAGAYPLDLSVTESVARLASRHPLLQIEVIEGRWRDLPAMLLSGEIEVGVIETSFVRSDARFQVEELRPHQGHFYCRRGHPLAGRRGVTSPKYWNIRSSAWRFPSGPCPPAAIGSPAFLLDPVTGDLLPRVTSVPARSPQAAQS